MGLRLQLYATIHIGGYGSRGSPGRRSFVGWAKARLRRAHHPCRDTAGGHASLCPPYEFVALLLAMTTRYDSASSRRNRARVVVRNTLEKNEGEVNAGRPIRPITASATIVVETHTTQSRDTGITRHSPRNGLRLISRSPR